MRATRKTRLHMPKSKKWRAVLILSPVIGALLCIPVAIAAASDPRGYSAGLFFEFLRNTIFWLVVTVGGAIAMVLAYIGAWELGEKALNWVKEGD